MSDPASSNERSSPSALGRTGLRPASEAAQQIHHQMLAVLPDDHLVPRHPAVETAAALTRDADWLREQIRLRGLIWGIDDAFVLGTLWWYSASNWLTMPTVTSYFTTGRAVSGRLDDLVLFHQPDSRIPGSRSLELGPDSLDGVGAQLRESLGEVIGVLASIVGKGERRLWAFAADAIAGRVLWAAQQSDRTARAHEVMGEIVAAVGPDLPAPRLSGIAVAGRTGPLQRLHVRRGSCCLLYQVPQKGKCRNCPRQPPEERLRRLAAL